MDLRHGWSLTQLARWGTTFLAYPVGGLLARAVAGPVDSARAAVIGGGVVGLVVGTAQAVAAHGVLPTARWAIASAVGTAAGLALGASAAGYRTSAGALAAMGAITGLLLGVAQAVALPTGPGQRITWVAASAAMMSGGWLATAGIGVDVERQYATFGASGALLVTAASASVLPWVADRR